MAARRITQETFDAVVQENVDEFGLDPAEALAEAVEQFESQGVDLTNIVKAVQSGASEDAKDNQTHTVLQILESLRGHVGTANVDGMPADLKRFTEQCKLGFAQRYLAAQKDAYPTILACCRKVDGEKASLLAALDALSSLTDGQPDLLDAGGREFLMGILREHPDDPAVTVLAVRAVRHCCVKHEQNRQDLVKAGVLPLLTATVSRYSAQPELLCEACAALRVMTFDDDIRVPFGQAHDHAKMIVLENSGLKVLIEAAKAHPDNTSVLSELCGTLSRLAVRNEFCQDIVDLGGLTFMMSLLADSLDHQDLVKQVLSALRAMAGNDDVKDAIVSAGGAELIVMAMNRHIGNAHVCEHGCASLSVLALRKPNNCRVIADSGGLLVALQAMKAHPKALNVQKQACMVLRNLVSRTQELCPVILELGAEPLIRQALASHQDCGDLAQAALRDLGCEVELRELWTGKKGSLTQ
ncbi:armadillo repeat-containing protein 6 [Amia ocellicauda]|uniref:armadillo repeat-containing protein 6 n=1 Tax=Amia ocellicauda TaxID=2972642 RepID=UPI0034649056